LRTGAGVVEPSVDPRPALGLHGRRRPQRRGDLGPARLWPVSLVVGGQPGCIGAAPARSQARLVAGLFRCHSLLLGALALGLGEAWHHGPIGPRGLGQRAGVEPAAARALLFGEPLRRCRANPGRAAWPEGPLLWQTSRWATHLARHPVSASSGGAVLILEDVGERPTGSRRAVLNPHWRLCGAWPTSGWSWASAVSVGCDDSRFESSEPPQHRSASSRCARNANRRPWAPGWWAGAGGPCPRQRGACRWAGWPAFDGDSGASACIALTPPAGPGQRAATSRIEACVILERWEAGAADHPNRPAQRSTGRASSVTVQPCSSGPWHGPNATPPPEKPWGVWAAQSPARSRVSFTCCGDHFGA